MSRLVRDDLEALPGYVPGRTVPGSIKLASNELPFGPLPGVAEAIATATERIHRYPDMVSGELRSAIGKRLDVEPERIATGCGSVALVEHLLRAACLPGHEVIYAWRSFEAYPIIAATSGVTSVRVPNTPDGGHDLPRLADAVTGSTRVLLICNPNNPTGTAARRTEIDELLAAVPDDVLVVFDEAYREFVTDSEVPDALECYGDRSNVVVLRTFSKAWGLAGLRIGYLIARPEVAGAVHKLVTPFSTSVMAQAAALAALDAEEEMARRVALIVAERERVATTVRAAMASVPECHGNFVWLPLGALTTDFALACERNGVIVRAFADEGARVTIGTPEENDSFLAAFAVWSAAQG